jgi:acetyl esterase/lipase
LTTFQLLRAHPTVPAPAQLLHWGCYDLSNLPRVFNSPPDLILDLKRIANFVGAFLPGKTTEERKNPSISPFYEDLEKFRGRLPKALFTCGTADCLLDDTVMMGTKYLMAGGEAIVKIYEGGCHGFVAFEGSDLAAVCMDDMWTFIRDCLGKYSLKRGDAK